MEGISKGKRRPTEEKVLYMKYYKTSKICGDQIKNNLEGSDNYFICYHRDAIGGFLFL